MKAVLLALLGSLRAGFRSRAALQLEVLALRHKLAVYQRCPTRPRTKVADRLLWAWLSKTWAGWRDALVFVQPSTVIAWQRRRFRDHWARLSRARPGRARLAKAVQDLIRTMSSANPTWGSPRIVGELAKLGISVAKATVEKYMVRPRPPPSPTWRAFLDNHVKDLVSVDFFVVPTVAFKVLFVFIVRAHARRRIVHFNVTEHPTAQWTAHQISEAFPWEAAPRYLLRDRDSVYDPAFRTRVEGMGIAEVLTALRSPWQNPFAERVIGSVRRECLDQVIVLDERHLRRLLGDYFEHYHRPDGFRTTTSRFELRPGGKWIFVMDGAAPNVGTWIGRRDRTLLLLAIQTGLRNSEIASLRRRDVTTGTGAHVRCTGKGRKMRCTPLRKDVAALVAHWLREVPADAGAPLFPSARGAVMSADAIQRIVARQARSAGRTCPPLAAKKVHPHTLRHTAAMDLLRRGVDQTVIALWLGHESTATTQIYVHADLQLKERALGRATTTGRPPRRYRATDRVLAFLEGL